MAAWTYWTSNLPYFPAVLYFAASNVLFMRQADWGYLSNNATFYITFALLTLIAATLLNIVGLDVGKWLHNIGALAMWIPVMIVIGMGLLAYHRYGSATTFSLHSMIPSVRLNDLIFWSVLTFAFGGCETASFMGEEIKNARRTIPFTLFVAGLTVSFCYIIGTVCVLLALPANEINSLQGLVQAIGKTAERVGMPGVLPLAAFLIALSNIGASGAYLAACARLPFVAGIDRFLPPIRSAAPPLGAAMGCAADPNGDRRGIHLSRPGGNHRERRLRRSREHGSDYVFHSLLVLIRVDVQIAARTRRSGCHPRPGRKAGRLRIVDRGIRDNDLHDCHLSSSTSR